MKKMLNSVVIGIDFCNDFLEIQNCARGKQVKITYKPSKSKTSAILELIHTVLMGDMSTMGGARYLLTFIDDYSRKV